MNRAILVLDALLLALVLTSCGGSKAEPTSGSASTDTETAQLANPASVYCEDQGFTLEIRTADDGSQSGFCIFPDGSECEEWAYYRNECAPASEGESGSTTAAASRFAPRRAAVRSV